MDCGILLISVRMSAPFAPYMSCGSRANQEKPEALIILFRAKHLNRIFLRKNAALRSRAPEDFLTLLLEIFFSRPEPDPFRCAKNGAEQILASDGRE
jgi:hypothetical protein